MPYEFVFRVRENENNPWETTFQERLECEFCGAATAKGTPCRRRVCIGLPYCVTHSRQLLHLTVKPSTVPHAGKGLFVDWPVNMRATRRRSARQQQNPVVFRRGDVIALYHAEKIDAATLQARYRDYTAPYTLKIRTRPSPLFADGSIVRGLGTMANHDPHGNAEFHLRQRNRQNEGVLKATRDLRHGDEILINYHSGDENDPDAYQFNEPNTFYTTRYRRRRAGDP